MNSPGSEPRPVVPEHKLLRVIGRGSYGEVWLARTELGRHRAVKIVRRAHFLDDAPFQREYEGLCHYEPISRSHSSQLAILQVGRRESEGFFYSVMELADDLTGKPAHSRLDEASYQPKTLRSFLRVRGHLSPTEVLELALALADSLVHLHSHGLCHRDLKPSNVIFSGGRPKLADVGLVSPAAEHPAVGGTVGFSAPEGTGSATGDLYSLGKVLYEALTGRDREEFPRLPRELKVPAEEEARFQGLNEILLRCADPDPGRRYSDALELLDDLRTLHAGRHIGRSFPSPLVAWGVLVTLLVAVIVVFVRREIGSAKTPGGEAAWEPVPVIAGPLTNAANGHRYFLLRASAQEAAVETAHRMGGYLAVIRNSQEQEWVFQTFGNLGGEPRNLWIGLEDDDPTHNNPDLVLREQEFRWENGEPVTYTHWGSSEPNNYEARNETFAHMWAPGDHSRSGYWNSAASVPEILGRGIHGVVELGNTNAPPTVNGK